MSKKNRKKLGSFEIPSLRNASKTLLANIRFASVDERVKTLVVTSSTPNEGKTTVSSNLACAIASAGHKVLLVDIDMRRRCLASMLDIHPRYGLYSVLSGEAQLSDAIVPTRYENLYFMDSEPNIPSPPDLLSTRRFAALVDKLRETYDYVIFDTPPLGTFVDAAIVSNLVDGTILVVREHGTKRDAVANVIQQLKAANARILGCVMTFTSESDNDYYYAYYNEDGKRVNKSESVKPTPAVDLADDDITSWARRAGVETSSHEGRNRHTAHTASNAGANTSAPAATNASAGSNAEAGTSEARPRTNNPRMNTAARNGHTDMGGYGAADNPYAPGAFKPASAGRQPRHKSRRI